LAQVGDRSKREGTAQTGRLQSDDCQVSNGGQAYRLVGFVMQRKPSPDFLDYWRRHVAA
jgi:hypothetical protein